MGISNKRNKSVLKDASGTVPLSRYPSVSEAPAPCKPELESFKTVEPKIPAPAGYSPDVYQNHPKPSVSRPLRVSPEQRRRIIYRYVELGESFRKISREEQRARQTVTRLIKTAPETLAAERELEDFQQQMTRQFRAMTFSAFESLTRGMKNDVRVALRVIEMLGIPERRKRR
jgi:hypothetical protein